MISFREVSDVMDMVFFPLFNSSSNIFGIIMYINYAIMEGESEIVKNSKIWQYLKKILSETQNKTNKLMKNSRISFNTNLTEFSSFSMLHIIYYSIIQ